MLKYSFGIDGSTFNVTQPVLTLKMDSKPEGRSWFRYVVFVALLLYYLIFELQLNSLYS